MADRANLAYEANKASLADKANDAAEANEANEVDLMLLDNGNAIVYLVLYSLTIYSAIVAKMKEYFRRTISNNQHRKWSSCSLRMRDHVKFNNQLEVDNRS